MKSSRCPISGAPCEALMPVCREGTHCYLTDATPKTPLNVVHLSAFMRPRHGQRPAVQRVQRIHNIVDFDARPDARKRSGQDVRDSFDTTHTDDLPRGQF